MKSYEFALNALKKMFPDPVGLHEPEFSGNEWKYVKECLDTGWVSSVGSYVDRFEKDLATYTGAKYAVAVMNGTAALQVCLRLVGVKTDDEVLVPALTFVATGNAITHAGAIPHFIDSEPDFLSIDANKLKNYLEKNTDNSTGECINKLTRRRIKAIICVHILGLPGHIDSLIEITKKYKLELIEDAAESLGSFYKDKHTGTFGKVSALSFNGNKIITTGGGGAVLTDDEHLGKFAKHLTTTAKKPHPWEFFHDELGYNYRMPNINAALGCAQLERINNKLESKRKLMEHYKKVFSGTQGLRLINESEHSKSNCWLNAICFNDMEIPQRDEFLNSVNALGIQVRPLWDPLTELPIFKNTPRMNLDQTEDLVKRIVCLPSSDFLYGKLS